MSLCENRDIYVVQEYFYTNCQKHGVVKFSGSASVPNNPKTRSSAVAERLCR